MNYEDLIKEVDAQSKAADNAIASLLQDTTKAASLLKKAVVVNVMTGNQGPQRPGMPQQQMMGSQMGGGMPIPSPLALAGVFPVGPGPKPIIRPLSAMSPSMQQMLMNGGMNGYRPGRRLGFGRPKPRRRMFLM